MTEGRAIPLHGVRGRGLSALVSPEDVAALAPHRWNVSAYGYAFRTVRLDDGRRTTLLMHRALLCPAPGFEVDHINGNRLDNRRENLRVVTVAQNQQNRQRARRDSSTGVRNVERSGKRFAVRLYPGGRAVYVGTFATLEEAAAAAQAARRQHFTHAPECRVAPSPAPLLRHAA